MTFKDLFRKFYSLENHKEFFAWKATNSLSRLVLNQQCGEM